jgi:putative hydrolase of the HAD superfamily
MKQIKNIFFDLGSVLLDIDVGKTMKSFEKQGISVSLLERIYETPDNFFLLFERGAISKADFRNEIRSLAKNNMTDSQIDSAWSAMVVGFQNEIIDLLISLKQKHYLFLLSNTNEIHVPVYTQMFRETSKGISFDDIFSKIYYSHVVKLSKPNPAIYTYVLEDSGVDPKESVFIDDLLQNVNSANEAGLPAYQLTEEERLTDLLKRINIVY